MLLHDMIETSWLVLPNVPPGILEYISALFCQFMQLYFVTAVLAGKMLNAIINCSVTEGNGMLKT